MRDRRQQLITAALAAAILVGAAATWTPGNERSAFESQPCRPSSGRIRACKAPNGLGGLNI